jgi:hypothetical protein
VTSEAATPEASGTPVDPVAVVRQRGQRELRNLVLSTARRLCNAADEAQHCTDTVMVDRIKAAEQVVYDIADDLLKIIEDHEV